MDEMTLVDYLIDNISSFDPTNDDTHIYNNLTAHRSLVVMLEKKQHPTTQDLRDAAYAGILNCPAGHLDAIFRFVSSPHDLAQACKVNSRFFATGLLWLYRNLDISLKNWKRQYCERSHAQM